MNLSQIKIQIFKIAKSIRIALMSFLIFMDDQRKEAFDFLAPIIDRLPSAKKIFSRRNQFIRYIYKIINTTIEAFFLILAVWFICYIFTYAADMMWRLYLETPMGEKFIILFNERALSIIELFNMDHFYFTVELTLSAFVICLAVGAVCHFFHILYYLYHSQGFFRKLVFWGIPLTALVAYYIKYEYGFTDWKVACAIALIPTYLLFISCFTYSQSLLPEAGQIIDAIEPGVKSACRFLLTKIVS